MFTSVEDFRDYAIESHRATNHMYDKYLPYEFHLRMVVEVGKKFKHLIPQRWWFEVSCALWGHDLIEDARQSYNDVKERSTVDTAEMIRAVTNYGRGRDRKERMPDVVYEDIRKTSYAEFVKLCDRIANVQYGKMMGSSMYQKYKGENEEFVQKIGYSGIYKPMYDYLEDLLKD